VAKVVECLLCKLEALNSNPSPADRGWEEREIQREREAQTHSKKMQSQEVATRLHYKVREELVDGVVLGAFASHIRFQFFWV
jgi:hypothetical protein